MKNDKLIIVALIVLILLNLTSWGLFWKSTANRHALPPLQEDLDVFRSQRLLSGKLNFSNEQERALKQLQKSHFQEMKDLRKRHRLVRQAFVKMAMGPSYNSEMADSLFQEMTVLNGEMQKKTWLHFRDIYQLCDKGQKKEFRSIMLRLNKLNSRKRQMPLVKPH
ncbi:Spy/CpxP family protein refolding chaperone [Marinilabilia rubra]|uniref:Periplasmic heavy metal sensor n=1 Tax=Marinilabilia rubra TaxID=2162893 RepID=A0A2U2B8N6_9BACT|nr:periplasmic heavy metal sensor [Marinilabilia rubra]PWD99430.1 hypothetical protein DDZ16_10505 [Marinilabilia rubra]